MDCPHCESEAIEEHEGLEACSICGAVWNEDVELLVEPTEAAERRSDADWKAAGALVRDYREEAGLSLRDLADRIGLASHNPIAQLERGERSVSDATLLKLRIELGIPIVDLFGALGLVPATFRPKTEREVEAVIRVVQTIRAHPENHVEMFIPDSFAEEE